MFMINQHATLLQIFCDFVINSQVISKSIKSPDDTLILRAIEEMRYVELVLFLSGQGRTQYLHQ